MVRHAGNRGLAAAVRTGLQRGLETAGPEDILITMDADNTHPPDLIPLMVARVREGADIVIASRFRPGARVVGVPWHRQLLSLGASWLYRFLFPIRGVRDYTCGFRAYRASLLREGVRRWGEALISESGFAVTVDLLLKLRPLHPRIAEVPLILRYDLKPGASKMHVARTIRQSLVLALRRKLGRL